MNRPTRSLGFFAPWLVLLLIVFVPNAAHAHGGVESAKGFSHGFFHPVTGWDHICAMIAVGLWAAQRGGRAIWLVPLTFVSVMAIGGALGMATGTLPFVEEGIVISVLILGVLIASAARLPLAASAVIVGLFAIFHGHAHGAEMPQSASGFAYGAGFIIATALLHLCGIGIAFLVERSGQIRLVRFAGFAIALCGVYLWIQ